ncbi:MAG TPA: BMC domain-containing protein [Acidobacteriaceae bacterium]|nr:BMC domain-containing protein [Acidobacteriaceae bacterium]
MSTELRSFDFIDRLQPQTLCFLGTTIRGFLPRANDAAMVVEIAPSLDVEWLTDIVLKEIDVKPGVLVVERQFGYLEFHAPHASAVKAAGAAILDALGFSEADVPKPQILASRQIDRVDPLHSFLVNRNKRGSMLLPGQSLFLLETKPAASALLAANEAEKAADIDLVDCRFMGASGRLYVSGTDSAVRAASEAAVAVLQGRSV